MTVHKNFPLKQQNCKGLQIVVAGKTDTISALFIDCYSHAPLDLRQGAADGICFGL